ncbi:efflux RND transporter permease subunit [Sphingomonas sp. H39-1-10]|uniref:efflux RND transporter permease subunit n=1 Tax=Sphingomonas pollutisoli TaxID=3030829 RepID=UPI0023B94762|nr:efflux RND transporter permease subunit [Sphingomonas pollutisoli]MDF0488421.1 efflux RND transporter permease subunit [Sphingomonas pollutisoli]
MSPSRIFILRPVATALLMVGIVLAGLVGFRMLSLSALPEVDYPTIEVTTLYPGGSPEVMSQTVTAPLERQFGEMPGLTRMASTSSAGASVITLQFGLSEGLDVAEQEVQAAINAASALLPADLPAPPVYAKVNPADAPVLTIAISSKTMPLTQVQSIVDTRLAQKISQISGVGLVSLAGGQKPAMRIRADTQALASFGLSLSQLRTAIDNANANSAKGSFDGPNRSYQINANDQLETVDDYKNLIVAYANAAPVRLSQVAQVTEGAENARLGALAGTTPAIILNVQRQPGANVIQTTDAIKSQLPELLKSLPAGLDAKVIADRTTGIRASVSDVEFELVLAVLLVVLVIFFFLHSGRATLVAGLAVPISLIGTFGVMYLLGYSLDNLSLMALTIATGFVVDDAIVMIENIQRHIEEGIPPFEAALKGAGEIGFTIISLTVSLIAVLIPLLFMGDIVGRLFREFAVTLAVTILISAVVSLTLTPMLSARWLKAPAEDKPSRIAQRSAALFGAVERRYEKALGFVLDRRFATLLVAIGTLILTVLLYLVIPKGLFPTQDTGQLQARLVASTSVSYDKMASLQAQAAKAILQDDDVASLSAFVGVDGSDNATLNSGSMFINLKESHGSQVKVMQRLTQAVDRIPGVTLYLQPTQDLTIDAESGPTRYRLSIEGSNTADVNAEAKRIAKALQSVSKVRNVTTDAGAQGSAAFINIDRDTAARLNITASSVDDALYSAFGQRIVSTIFTETTQYRVILEAAPGLLTDPQSLGLLHLQASGGATPLNAIATIREGSSPLQVTHVAQFPAATIGFDTAPGVSLGSAVDAIKAKLATLNVKRGISTTFLGAAGAFANSLTNQLYLILAAIVCVYIVLGVLYESFIHPVTILSTLPSAAVGALFALWVTGHDLDVIGIIGIVLLIGIVKKNAIMMIDFAIAAERDEGLPPLEAIRQAAILRFRPILMTTLAALFAAIPLMVGMGEGAELRRPLGIAIFGGLMVSQLLTIFTTPVVYLYFDRAQQSLARRGWGARSSPDVGPEARP